MQQLLQSVSLQTKAHQVLSSLCRRARPTGHWHQAGPITSAVKLRSYVTDLSPWLSSPLIRSLAPRLPRFSSPDIVNPKYKPLSNPDNNPDNNTNHYLFRTSAEHYCQFNTQLSCPCSNPSANTNYFCFENGFAANSILGCVCRSRCISFT